MESVNAHYRVLPPLQIPLFHVLLPYLAGMVIGMPFSLSAPWIPAVFAFFLPLFLVLLWRCRKGMAYPLFFLLFLFLGFLRWEAATPRISGEVQAKLDSPPREVLVEFEVQRLYRAQGNRPASGIARIVQADPHLAVLTGSKLYFELWQDQGEGQLLPSSRIRARGVLSGFAWENHPLADSDFQGYLEQQGIHFSLTEGSIREITYPGHPFRRWCAAQNRRFAEILDTGPDSLEQGKAIWKAMMLGETQYLTQSMKAEFRHSGTMHFFAISGLHIGIMATLIGAFLRTIRIPMAKTPWVGLPLLFLFVQITGNSPSALRAWIMITFFWMALALNRKPVPLNAWIASALFTLLFFPRQLLNPGFQLSYAVVGMILLYGLPLAEWLSSRGRPFQSIPTDLLSFHHRLTRGITRRFLEGFAISLAAFLISQPISTYFFGLISPVSLLLNIFLVILAFPVILSGMVCLIVGSFLPASWLLPLTWATCHLLELKLFLIQLFTQIPGSSLSLEVTQPQRVAMFSAILLGIALLVRARLRLHHWGKLLLLPPLTFCFLFPLLLV